MRSGHFRFPSIILTFFLVWLVIRFFLPLFSPFLLGTLLAVWLYNNFCGYLNILNTFLPSIGAILAADYFLVAPKKQNADEAPGKGIPAIIAWAAGTLVANFLPVGLTAVNGMVVAFAVYTAAARLTLAKQGN